MHHHTWKIIRHQIARLKGQTFIIRYRVNMNRLIFLTTILISTAFAGKLFSWYSFIVLKPMMSARQHYNYNYSRITHLNSFICLITLQHRNNFIDKIQFLPRLMIRWSRVLTITCRSVQWTQTMSSLTSWCGGEVSGWLHTRMCRGLRLQDWIVVLPWFLW